MGFSTSVSTASTTIGILSCTWYRSFTQSVNFNTIFGNTVLYVELSHSIGTTDGQTQVVLVATYVIGKRIYTKTEVWCIFELLYICSQCSCSTGVDVGTVKVEVNGSEFTDKSWLIGIKRVRTHFNFLSVSEAVPVGVRVIGIGSVYVDFVIIIQTVTIGICTQWIGTVLVDLITIRQTITIGVGIEWIGTINQYLVTIAKTIIVGVSIQGVGTGSVP